MDCMLANVVYAVLGIWKNKEEKVFNYCEYFRNRKSPTLVSRRGCAASHATQAFPSHTTRAGMTYGSMSFLIMRDKDDPQKILVLKTKDLTIWYVGLFVNSLQSMDTKEEPLQQAFEHQVSSVEDGFFLPKTRVSCISALIVHDDGVGGLTGTQQQ